jgi:hypothetical protein
MEPTLLVFRWLLEVDARSSRKSHKSLREKENNLKPQKLEQFLNQNEKATCLKNMKKQKIKESNVLEK